MSSTSMSAGASYFLEKYKLARDQLANSEGCSCTVKDQEKYMTAPYKSKAATETAKLDLTGLRDVIEHETARFEEFLRTRREELKKKEQQEHAAQNAAKNQNSGNSQPATKINSILRNATSSRPPQPSGAALASPPPTPPANNSSPLSGQSQTGSKYPPGPSSRIRLMTTPPRSPSTSTVGNSSRATTGQSKTSKYPPSLGARIHLKLKESERVLTPIWRQNVPTPVTQPNQDSPAPVETQNIQKRKNEGLFDLESAAKRPHLGYCAPCVYEIKKPFIADKYSYKEREPAAIPKQADIYTKHRAESTESEAEPTGQAEAPAEGATTRRKRAAGAKLVEPQGDTGNFSREGGLAKEPTTDPTQNPPRNGLKKLPRNGGTKAFKLTKAEVNNDYKAMAKMRKDEALKEAIFKPLREELFAFARRHESEEYTPSRIYNSMIAKRAERKARLEKYSKNRNLVMDGYQQAKQAFEEAKLEFTERKLALRKQQDANEDIKPIAWHVKARFRKSRASWNRVLSQHLESIKRGKTPEQARNDLQRSQREEKVRQQRLDELTTDYQQKWAALTQARVLRPDQKRKDCQEAIRKAIPPLEDSGKILRDYQQEHDAWLLAQHKELNAGHKIVQPKARTITQTKESYCRTGAPPDTQAENRMIQIPAELQLIVLKEGEKEPNSSKSSYKKGRKCAFLAKDTVEAKEKLVTITRELDTINKKIGTDPSTIPRLSAIPAHIRMLPGLNLRQGKPTSEFVIKTNAHVQRTPQLRKPSNLRYELGACLVEKAAAEAAAEIARVAAEAAAEAARIAKEQEDREEERRQQAAIEAMNQRKQRKRAEIVENRRKYAMNQAKETVETGFLPRFQDEKDRQEFNWALRAYLQSEEGMRAQARRVEKRRNHTVEQGLEERGKLAPCFCDSIEKRHRCQFVKKCKPPGQESDSEGTVQEDRDKMEGVESGIGGKVQGEGEEMEGVECQVS
jgi:hypothetical protein